MFCGSHLKRTSAAALLSVVSCTRSTDITCDWEELVLIFSMALILCLSAALALGSDQDDYSNQELETQESSHKEAKIDFSI